MENLAYFNEKEYIEGFNLGYQISREIPELGELIYSARGETSRLDGLKHGRQQYLEDQLEKTVEQTQPRNKETHLSWLRSNDKQESKDKDKVKDKGHEPEM
jgi:hypothetical protein